MSDHRVEGRAVVGREAVTLVSDASGGVEATFVPGAGMVGCSLTHRGAELLGQRGGLERYIEERSTMGIPLLHPYANRLSRDRFDLGQREVDLARAGERVARDPNGLAIHGLLAGTPGWEIAAREAGADGARLAARYDAGAHQEVAAAFPFPHVIALELSLEDATLSIRTRVEPTGDVAVPISYGFHPYLRLPDVPRSDWEIRVPVREQVILDERNLPTGERRSVSVESGPLGDRTFDDVYSGVEAGTVFSVAGGGRRIEVEFEDGYPIAVVYAPDNDDVVCFEPMTAPTNAMVDGAPELRFVDPGDSQSAAWSLRIVEQ